MGKQRCDPSLALEQSAVLIKKKKKIHGIAFWELHIVDHPISGQGALKL